MVQFENAEMRCNESIVSWRRSAITRTQRPKRIKYQFHVFWSLNTQRMTCSLLYSLVCQGKCCRYDYSKICQLWIRYTKSLNKSTFTSKAIAAAICNWKPSNQEFWITTGSVSTVKISLHLTFVIFCPVFSVARTSRMCDHFECQISSFLRNFFFGVIDAILFKIQSAYSLHLRMFHLNEQPRCIVKPLFELNAFRFADGFHVRSKCWALRWMGGWREEE